MKNIQLRRYLGGFRTLLKDKGVLVVPETIEN